MKAICIVLVFGLLAAAGAPRARAELANGIVAIVDDSVITYDEVQTLAAEAAPVLRQKYAGDRAAFEKNMREVVGKNLDELVDRQLILHDFKTSGYSLPQSVLDELVQDRIRTKFGDRKTLTKTLDAQGMTYEEFRRQIREQFIIAQLRAKNISSEIIISPHKVETYYLAHRDQFKVEEEVKLRMIVLNKSGEGAAQTRKLAEEILTKLKEGAAFAEMATIYSQGSQRREGGDWGWVERSVLRPELADAAFALRPGERSGVVETTDYFYLMLVEDTRPIHFKPLTEVRDVIEKSLLLAEQQRLEKQWIDRLKKKTFVCHLS